MNTKTERITILATPNFKAFLHAQAAKAGVSVSELIRERCSRKPVNNADEKLLAALVQQVNISTTKAQESLSKGLNDVAQALAEIRQAKSEGKNGHG